MARFEGNWATREFIKGICSNARRQAKKMGDMSGTLPKELLDQDENDGDEGLDDDQAEDDPAPGTFLPATCGDSDFIV